MGKHGTDTGQFGTDPIMKVRLRNDFGDDLPITGHLIGEEMFFDESTGMLTIEKLYQTEDEHLGYSINSAIGHSRERRAYELQMNDHSCIASNGSLTLQFDTDDLFELLALALASERKEESSQVTEQLRRQLAANE